MFPFFLPSSSLSWVSSTGRTSPKTKLASLGNGVWGALASKLQCRTKEGMELKADTQTDAKTESYRRGSRQQGTYPLAQSSCGNTPGRHGSMWSGESRRKAQAEWRGKIFSWAMKEWTYFLPSQIRLHEEWYFELGLEEFSKLLQKCQFA